jgi:hypothetical protein
MTEIKKTISADDRLKVLALATIANQKAREADAFAQQMAELIGYSSPFDTKLHELVYSKGFTVAEFDQHLLWDGIAVEDRDG